MNNEAFRSLVNSNRKSTKEIAREAVENEFRKRKRRRDDQGYGSDSDSDAEVKPRRQHEDVADKEEGNDEPAKRGKREKKPEYRDRARERREGKVVDYALLDMGSNGQDGPLTAEDRKRQAELSKYLGGDEEHSHLVKGLDRVLAQKVRREEMGQKEDDFDELMDEAFEKRDTAAVATDGGLYSIKPKSELGRSMLSYLLQKQERSNNLRVKVNQALQKSLQRSVLTFSLNSDTRRRKHAWDAPQLSIQAFTNGNMATRNATPLNRQLITTISTKLKGHLLRVKHGNVTVSKSMSKSVEDNDGIDKTNLQNDNVGAKSVAKPAPDSDSDDDIFADVGDYVPPTAEEKVKENADTTNPAAESKDINTTGDATKKKQSIFDNLVTNISTAPTQPRKVQIQLPTQHQNRDVINREVIGASSNEQPITKRRGPQTAAMEGYSMSNYSGGYGEDIDVDFGNFDEDDRKKKKEDIKGDDAAKEEEDENDF